MGSKSESNGEFTVRAYIGDFKTLLAWSLPKARTRQLAGFTIQVTPPGGLDPFYIFNSLQFETPSDHAQDLSLPATSSINAPIHKFRWVHVPGSVHNGTKPPAGEYSYTVTPRSFDERNRLQPLDKTLGVTVAVPVAPFEKDGLRLGFTRGFTQSQAFVRHFGRDAKIRPKDAELLFDVDREAGVNSNGDRYTFAEEYDWLGSTARDRIFEILEEVLSSKALRLDVFAYDLNEPDVMNALLELAAQGRVRVILDNAALHHGTGDKSKPEDDFEIAFQNAAKAGAEILRGKFKRYAHDKVLLVRGPKMARRVLTGSTNFSVTGLYVNSNHVLVFGKQVAAHYAELFDAVWSGRVSKAHFLTSGLAGGPRKVDPRTFISFAPHEDEVVESILGGLTDRIEAEAKVPKDKGSVIFAVMEIGRGKSPVYETLRTLHRNERIFSFGISDTTEGIRLYKPGTRNGVLATGRPASTKLPAPFSQVPGVGIGHQVHHKFVVCGFNRPDAVVFCGSSNLASGGEADNGDNLLEIRDQDVATAFAIEGLLLVDHFNFLNRYAKAPGAPKIKKALAVKQEAAAEAGWFLSVSDRWVQPFYDRKDLRYLDRCLFS